MISSIDQCLHDLHSEFDVVAEIYCNYSDIGSAKVDLYSKLQKIRREQFCDNQRIVFVLEQDFYHEDAPAGALLQTLQIIVQDIDISNYFVCVVSSNVALAREHAYVHQTVSQDPVPFHCYTCHGDFLKLYQVATPMDGKTQGLKNIAGVLDTLSNSHKKLLFVDPVFCMMPWVGINIEPNNIVRPCCQYTGTIGNMTNTTISEIWNSESIKEIRRSMLRQKPVAGCQACYHKESLQRDSLRNSINRDFAAHMAEVDATHSDGTVAHQSILYWDIRFNNLCNFACRSCSPAQSSSWAQIHNDLYPDQARRLPLRQAGSDGETLLQEITQNIDRVEKIYFAGGEPLIIENFYRILEMLDARGRHDVHLCYNTNLSKLQLKQRSVLDLWKRFSKISVGASLDGMGPRAEYLRTGTVWQDIVNNRKRIQDHCPHVDFYVSATTGLINALHIPDFHVAWVEQNLITADDFNIQLLYDPAYMSVRNAPDMLREKIVERYGQHIKWLQGRDGSGRAISTFRSLVNFCKEPGQYDPNVFWQQVRKLDHYHSTDLISIFPELDQCGL